MNYDYGKDEDLIKLFVGGLNYISLQSDIKSYFETFGRVIECTLLVDKPSGKSRGFAFVTVEDTSIIFNLLISWFLKRQNHEQKT